jgi:hypothetical protein
MIPIVAGLLMGAAMGGGIAALQKKDILQGALMGAAGGALGGAFMPGVAGGAVGEGIGTAAGTVGTTASTNLPPAYLSTTGMAETGSMFAGGSFPGGTANLGLKIPTAMGGVPANTIASTGVPAGTGLTIPTSMANATIGAGGSGGIGSFLSANKGALMGGLGGGMLASNKAADPGDQGNIYTTQFSQEQNPNFGAPGEDYFSKQAYAPGTYTPVSDYKPTQMAANGGIIALAEGGEPGLETQRYSQPTRQMAPEVAAYNARMMEMANQQYNVNPRPGPMQVPGSVGYVAPTRRMAASAPTGDSVSGLRFNPLTQQFEGEFNAPGTKKKSDYDFDELDARYGKPNYYNHASGDGGGMAYGGAVGYNEGGLSSLGSYSDGGQLLKGPGDGVSDSIPAQIGRKQPARLADGEFVVPARVVSELGNGSTDAGAKQLYAMMDRVQNNRKKSIGKGKVAVDAKSRKHLPA